MEDRINKIRSMVEKARQKREESSEMNESYDSSMEYGRGRSGKAVPSAMSGETRNVDSGDVRPVSQLDDPETFSRMNMYVQRIKCTTPDPWKMVRTLHGKLHLVGLNFDLPHGEGELPTEPTSYIFDVNFLGGQTGFTIDGEWVDDDGFDGSYVLIIDIDPSDDGLWELSGELRRGDEIEIDDDMVDMNEECGCDKCKMLSDEDEEMEEECSDKKKITEGLSPYRLDMSRDAGYIFEIIDGDNKLTEMIYDVNDKVFRLAMKGRYNRRKVLKMYKDAVYNIIHVMERNDEYADDLRSISISSRIIVELSSYLADKFESDAEMGHYGKKIQLSFNNDEYM